MNVPQIPSLKFCSAFVTACLLTGNLYSTTLTWDPAPGGGGFVGGAGVWDTSTTNWWDGASNVTWNNATPDDAVFAGPGSGFLQGDPAGNSITLSDVTTTVNSITLPGGVGVHQLEASFSGDTILIPNLSGGTQVWSIGTGSTLRFINRGTAGADTSLTMTSGDTLQVDGDGNFYTGEKPDTGFEWPVSGANLVMTGTGELHGALGTVGQFASVALSGGSMYVHERNRNETYPNDWVLSSGTVRFDGRYNNRNITLSGIISGAGGLKAEKIGTGTGNNRLQLGGANTYSGDTTIADEAVLRVFSGGRLGDGTGDILFDANVSTRRSAVDYRNNEGLTLSGNITGVSGSEGIFRVTDGADVTVDGDITDTELQHRGANTVGVYNGNITGTTALAGVFTDFSNRNNTVLSLGGTNTYAGNTFINEANLIYLSDASISPNSNIKLETGALLLFGGTTSNSQALTIGTGGGQIQWTFGGGFGAVGADKIITLDGGAPITWGGATPTPLFTP